MSFPARWYPRGEDPLLLIASNPALERIELTVPRAKAVGIWSQMSRSAPVIEDDIEREIHQDDLSSDTASEDENDVLDYMQHPLVPARQDVVLPTRTLHEVLSKLMRGERAADGNVLEGIYLGDWIENAAEYPRLVELLTREPNA